MIDAQEIARRYIASWNEADGAVRWRLVDGLWTEDARYADPMMKADGRDGITNLIGGMHTRFPGYRFALTGQADEDFDGTWPFAPRFTEAAGFRQHYVDKGNGRPVLLPHGQPTRGYIWRK